MENGKWRIKNAKKPSPDDKSSASRNKACPEPVEGPGKPGSQAASAAFVH